jgi:hypothetical protein
MSEFSIYVADAIVGTALLIEKLKEIPGLGSQNAITRNNFLLNPSTTALAIIKKGVDYVRQLGKEFREPGMGGYPSSALGPGYVDPNELAAKRRMAAEKAAAKLQKQILANDNKRLKSEKARAALAKAQLALGRASKTLDLERIGIEAALKGEISETDRISLLLQKSILDENASLATQLAKLLEDSIRRQNELNALLLATPEAPNPYRNWTLPMDLLNYTASSLGVSVAQLQAAPIPITSSMSDAEMELASAVGSFRSAEAQLINVEVYLDGNAVGGAVRDSSVNDSLSGSFNTVNRFARFQQGMAP